MSKQTYIYDKELKKVIPFDSKRTLTPIKLYPFVTEDFNGLPVEVKSRSHYRELCRQHGVYAKHEFGHGYNISEI